jgi:hypothetical protein
MGFVAGSDCGSSHTTFDFQDAVIMEHKCKIWWLLTTNSWWIFPVVKFESVRSIADGLGFRPLRMDGRHCDEHWSNQSKCANSQWKMMNRCTLHLFHGYKYHRGTGAGDERHWHTKNLRINRHKVARVKPSSKPFVGVTMRIRYW